MVSELVDEGNFSEFELRRINMSIFRLFDVLLGLMVKSASKVAESKQPPSPVPTENQQALEEESSDNKYTLDNALDLYETISRLVDLLGGFILLRDERYSETRSATTKASNPLVFESTGPGRPPTARSREHARAELEKQASATLHGRRVQTADLLLPQLSRCEE